MTGTTADPLLTRRIRLAAGIAAGALIGFGLILWIAANWGHFGKAAKFGIVGGALVAGALAAMAHSALRIPGALVAFAATGGIFALFGQIYQSGSDPWQLFALWAALGLPLALAARHDALWVPWTVVAFSGIPLWMEATKRSFGRIDLQTALSGWALAATLIAGLLLVGRSKGTLGTTRWAARIGGMMALGLVGSLALTDVFARGGSLTIFWAAMALLTAAALILAFAKPLDLSMLVAVALTIDVLLISWIGRKMFVEMIGNFEAISFFTMFFISAGIIGGTATALLKWHRHRTALAETGQNASAPRTWPITILSGVGALLAAIPLMIFFAMFFDTAFKRGPAIFIIAALLIGAAMVLFKISRPLSFGQQFGFIGLVVGLLLTGGGLLRDLPHNIGTASGIMLVLVSALAFVIRIGWVRNLLGAAAAVCLSSFIKSQLLGESFTALFREHPHGAMTVAALACLMLLRMDADAREHPDNDGLLRAYGSGFTASALAELVYSAGPTFLLGRGRGMFEGLAGTGWHWSEWLAPALSILATLAGAALLFARRPELRSPLALVIVAVLAALSAVSNTLGFAVLVLAAAVVGGRNVLALFAAMAALWIIGTLYYALNWPLDRKSFLLVTLGSLLALAVFLTRTASQATPLATTSGLRPLIASGLIGLSTVATAGVLGIGIREKEAILTAGRTIYLELVPVDPRSLMQGDFMALRFAQPVNRDKIDEADRTSRTPVGIATIDAQNKATIAYFAIAPHTPPPGERVVKLRRTQGTWRVGTDAWFFPEGEGKKFEAAKFGEFRLGPAGDLILVGMADKDLKPIR